MSIKGYTRGIPTYTTTEGDTYGMLCETKEKCITDDDGISLESKLSDIKRQIEEGVSNNGGDADTLGGHSADYFATADDLLTVDAKTLDGHGAEYFASAEELERLTVTRYIGYSEDEINTIYESLNTNATNGEWYRARVHHDIAHSVLGGGTWYVEGYKQSNTYAWQKITCYKPKGARTYGRSLNGSTTWSEWTEDFTTAGGTINGNTYVKQSGSASAQFGVGNDTNEVKFGVSGDGFTYFQDAFGNFIVRKADGTSTFNGTASGNLPKSGGTIDGGLSIKTKYTHSYFGEHIYETKFNESSVSLLNGIITAGGSIGGNKGSLIIDGANTTFKSYVTFDYNQIGFKKAPEILGTNGTVTLATTETGTFDLTFTYNSVSYTLSGYNYLKVGKFVMLYGSYDWAGDTITKSGGTDITLSGLPFPIYSPNQLHPGYFMFATESVNAPIQPINIGTNKVYEVSTNSFSIRQEITFKPNYTYSLLAMYITQ